MRAAEALDTGCFHCGLPVRAEGRHQVVVRGAPRSMCCVGCAAVAEAIVGNGLESYYDRRESVAGRPAELVPAALRELAVFDDPAVQAAFGGSSRDGVHEATLLVEGIQCPACVWLNESRVRALDGVVGFELNYATHRGRVRWDASRIRLSDVLGAIARLGYVAKPYDAARAEAARKDERKRALWRLFVAGFGMMQVMMYAVPAYLAGEGDMTADIEQLMRVASLLLTIPVMAYAAWPFFVGASRDARAGRLGMDVPVAIGIAVAFAGSLWNTLVVPGEVWYDSITMFVFFLLGGRYLELMARQRAARTIEALAARQPASAERLAGFPGSREAETVPASRLAPGDHVLLRAGATVPADGVVVEGTSKFDESLTTGESAPVERGRDARLIGGSVNVAAPVVMRVDRVGPDTWVAGITRLVERAARERPRLVRLADRYAGAFVAVILTLAALVAFLWWPHSPSRAIEAAVAVLVVTCPCALSLATPLALTAATSALARAGVLVAAPDALERLARVDRIVLDKTGTLTEGRMALAAVDVLGDPARADVLAIAAALEANAVHPVAAALREAAARESITAPTALALTEVSGQGVEGEIAGIRYRLGRGGWAAPAAAPRAGMPQDRTGLLEDPRRAARTIAVLAADARPIAVFAFADPLRAEAAATVRALDAAGLRPAILSGDRQPAVAAAAELLAIPPERARGDCRPEDKHAEIERLQSQGRVVAMVGDGVNDAPVLARADVSFALAAGASLAQLRADVVLIGNRLDRIVFARGTARRTAAVVRQNLAWAFAYNVAAVPLAALGYVPPWLASLGMAASSLVVVANSLRLLPAQRGSTDGAAADVSGAATATDGDGGSPMRPAAA